MLHVPRSSCVEVVQAGLLVRDDRGRVGDTLTLHESRARDHDAISFAGRNGGNSGGDAPCEYQDRGGGEGANPHLCSQVKDVMERVWW